MRQSRLLSSFCVVILFILSGCSGDSKPTESTRAWYWEHELTGSDAKIATEDHTVIMHIKPPVISTKSKETTLASKTIPITYKRSGVFKYCIEKDDPLFISFTVSDSSGKVITSVKQGECKETNISAGIHNVTVEYVHNNIGAKGKIAFIKPLRPITNADNSSKMSKGTNKSISSGGVDVSYAGKLAILTPDGKLLTISDNYKTNDGKDNYYLIAVPKNVVSTNNLLWFQKYRSSNQLQLMSSKGMLGGRGAGDPLTQDQNNRWPNDIADCFLYNSGTSAQYDYHFQTSLYTYSSDHKGTPPNNAFSVDDMNYSKWKFTLKMVFTVPSHFGMYFDSSSVGMSGGRLGQACSRYNFSSDLSAIFQVWFRYYEDASKVPALQSDEIALYEKANYQGRVWIFNADVADFNQIQDMAKNVRSIKTVGRLISLYTQPNFTGSSLTFVGDLSDISNTSIKDGIASMKVVTSTDIKSVLLSSKSCLGCNLDGIRFVYLYDHDLDGLDMSYSSMKGATFSGVKISNCNFSNADLSGSSFDFFDNSNSPLIISKSNFTNAKLDKSTFIARIYRNVAPFTFLEINDSNFNNASMRAVQLVGVVFRNTSMVNANLSSFYNVTDDMKIENIIKRCDAPYDPNRTYVSGGKFDRASLSYLSNEDGKRLILNGVEMACGLPDTDGLLQYGFMEAIEPSKGGKVGNSQFMSLQGATFTGCALTLSYDNYPADISNANFKNFIFGDLLIMQNVKNSCADPTNLTGCADFSGAVMTSMYVNNSNLKGVNFNGARLTSTDLDSTFKCRWISQSANFTDSDLSGTDLSNVIANDVNFTRVSLKQSKAKNAVFRNAIFQGATIVNSNLQGANFCKAKFNKDSVWNISATFDGSYMQNVNLAYTDLSGASMQNVSIHSMTSHATCVPDSSTCETSSCSSAVKATMSNVRFSNSYISGLDMSGATLTGAAFDNVIAVGVNFNSANLSNDPTTGMSSNFNYALLFGADFTNAKVQGAKFNNAYFDDQVNPSSNKASVIAYLPSLMTNFPASPFPSQAVCPKYSAIGYSIPPSTDNSVLCPDSSRGPCRGAQWKSSASMDASKLSVSYDGKPAVPSSCPPGSPFLFW